METRLLFMVEFILPQHLDESFTKRLPEQRVVVDELFEDNRILSYTLSLEHKRIWMIVSTESENELQQIIGLLPLSKKMEKDYCLITFHITKPSELPEFSLN